jgi:hypothetical protein
MRIWQSPLLRLISQCNDRLQLLDAACLFGVRMIILMNPSAGSRLAKAN